MVLYKFGIVCFSGLNLFFFGFSSVEDLINFNLHWAKKSQSLFYGKNYIYE